MSTAEIHIMYRNGEPTLVNGQHTCLAIQKYGKPVRVTVRKTNTSEPGQIAMTYAFGHDTHLRRGWADQMNAYGLTDTTGLDRQNLDRLSAALRFAKNSFGQSKNYAWLRPTGNYNSGEELQRLSSPAELMEIVESWAPYMKLFNIAVQPCEKPLLRTLRSRAILSVGLVTFQAMPDEALDFWRQVVRMENIDEGDPRRLVLRYARQYNAREKGAEPTMARQVARCWEAFCKGEKLHNTKRIDPASNIVIFGTKYNGKQERDYLPSIAGARNAA